MNLRSTDTGYDTEIHTCDTDLEFMYCIIGGEKFIYRAHIPGLKKNDILIHKKKK
jgi:hypothetical protein